MGCELPGGAQAEQGGKSLLCSSFSHGKVQTPGTYLAFTEAVGELFA